MFDNVGTINGNVAVTREGEGNCIVRHKDECSTAVENEIVTM
jgi:hypothetical protein